MATSIWKGRLQYATTDLSDNDPLDTAHSLGLINNSLHYADSVGQVRVAWGEISGGGLSMTRVLTTTGTFYQVGCAFGPWPATAHHSGQSYLYRVRLAGANAQAYTVTWRVVVSRYEEAERACLAAGVNVYSFTSAQGPSAAWIGGATLYLTAADMAAASRPLDSLDGVGGNTVSTDASLMYCTVWAKQTAGTTTASIAGLYVAEYVGT